MLSLARTMQDQCTSFLCRLPNEVIFKIFTIVAGGNYVHVMYAGKDPSRFKQVQHLSASKLERLAEKSSRLSSPRILTHVICITRHSKKEFEETTINAPKDTAGESSPPVDHHMFCTRDSTELTSERNNTKQLPTSLLRICRHFYPLVYEVLLSKNRYSLECPLAANLFNRLLTDDQKRMLGKTFVIYCDRSPASWTEPEGAEVVAEGDTAEQAVTGDVDFVFGIVKPSNTEEKPTASSGSGGGVRIRPRG